MFDPTPVTRTLRLNSAGRFQAKPGMDGRTYLRGGLDRSDVSTGFGRDLSVETIALFAASALFVQASPVMPAQLGFNADRLPGGVEALTASATFLYGGVGGTWSQGFAGADVDTANISAPIGKTDLTAVLPNVENSQA